MRLLDACVLLHTDNLRNNVMFLLLLLLCLCEICIATSTGDVSTEIQARRSKMEKTISFYNGSDPSFGGITRLISVKPGGGLQGNSSLNKMSVIEQQKDLDTAAGHHHQKHHKVVEHHHHHHHEGKHCEHHHHHKHGYLKLYLKCI